MTPRLKEQFDNEVIAKVAEEFGIKNKHAQPKLDKVVINVGMGKELDGMKVKKHVLAQVLSDLELISGQKPVLVKARKSVSNFKVREGSATHAMVTLRRDRMWEFLDRLINLTIPRFKDFQGLNNKSFDKQGNYSMGVTEQGVFLEINMAEATYMHGMNINIVISNSTPEISYAVLEGLGMPFKKKKTSEPKAAVAAGA